MSESGAKHHIGCGGGGLTTVLLAVFLTLKLTDQIDWSWWWVLSPLWIPVAFGVAAALLVGIGAGAFFAVRHFHRRRPRLPR